jgi:hypothetical protein
MTSQTLLYWKTTKEVGPSASTFSGKFEDGPADDPDDEPEYEIDDSDHGAADDSIIIELNECGDILSEMKRKTRSESAEGQTRSVNYYEGPINESVDGLANEPVNRIIPTIVYYTVDPETNNMIDTILDLVNQDMPRKDIAAKLNLTSEKLYTFMSRHMPWHIKLIHSSAKFIDEKTHDEIYARANIKKHRFKSKKEYLLALSAEYGIKIEHLNNIRKRDIPRKYQKHPHKKAQLTSGVKRRRTHKK